MIKADGFLIILNTRGQYPPVDITPRSITLHKFLFIGFGDKSITRCFELICFLGKSHNTKVHTSFIFLHLSEVAKGRPKY